MFLLRLWRNWAQTHAGTNHRLHILVGRLQPSWAGNARDAQGNECTAWVSDKAGSPTQSLTPFQEFGYSPQENNFTSFFLMENPNFSIALSIWKPTRIPDINIYSLLGGTKSELTQWIVCSPSCPLWLQIEKMKVVWMGKLCSFLSPITLPPSLHSPKYKYVYIPLPFSFHSRISFFPTWSLAQDSGQ